MAKFWDRLKNGMSKTRTGFGDRIRSLFQGREWDDDLWDELEAVLYEADLGVATTDALLAELRSAIKWNRPAKAEGVIESLEKIMVAMLTDVDASDSVDPPQVSGPQVWLLVGVNGTGKTTTAGKFAASMKNEGKRVILGAADTFRAAAVDQLVEWGKRAGVDVVRQASGSDPAAVAFDTVQAARSRHMDLAIIDTAGRLHNKVHLMKELEKIIRVIKREDTAAPHEVFLVIDATTGQNGLLQAQVFLEAVHVTGIILTKLDGTAKGGIALAIHRELRLPIRYVGVGEKVTDLMPFDPAAYVKAILSNPNG